MASYLRASKNLAKSPLKQSICSSIFRQFSIGSAYSERANKKMQGTHSVPDVQQYHVSPSRPSNFGDHLDFKINVDNHFDESRVHNEEDIDVRRTYNYILSGLWWGSVIAIARIYVVGIIGRLNGWKRYDKDTYMEFDVSILPPGEVVQVLWCGVNIFIRRLTAEE